MKRNLFDVFDNYSGDLPDITSQKTNTKTIETLVMKKISSKKKICRSRIFVIGIAAAVIAGGSITASAVSDTGFFHKILSRSEYASTENISLPMVQEDVYEKMSDNFKFDQVAFTGNENCDIKLEAMYSDNSTAMIVISLKPDETICIEDNSSATSHFTVLSENGDAVQNTDVMTDSAEVVYNEEDQKYYMTYYLTSENLSGNYLQIEIQGIYSHDQMSECQTRLLEYQDGLRKKYNADNMSVEEWKKLWKKENFDLASHNAMREYYEQSGGINGNWTSVIQLPDRSDDIITSKTGGFTTIIDNLSVAVEYPEDYENHNADIVIVEFTDGTKMTNASGTNIERNLKKSGFGEYSIFAFGSGLKCDKPGDILCYDAPHSPQEISSVTFYQAEDKPDGNISKYCVLYEKNK